MLLQSLPLPQSLIRAKKYVESTLRGEEKSLLGFYMYFTLLIVVAILPTTQESGLRTLYWCCLVGTVATIVLREWYGMADEKAALLGMCLVTPPIAAAGLTFGGTSSMAMLWYLGMPMPILVTLGFKVMSRYLVFTAISVIAITYHQYTTLVPRQPEPGSHLGWILISLFAIALSLFAIPAISQYQLKNSLRLIRHRHHELTQIESKLIEQQKQQDAFVASISHELRTPMHGIMGFLQTVGPDNQMTAHNQQMFEAMQYSAKHLMTVINDLLDFSQIQTGSLRIIERPMNLRVLLGEVSHMFEMRLSEKGVALRLQMDASVPEWVMGDADRLSQILINLLGNAAKFTAQGHVELRAKFGDDQRLHVAVEDTGCGIEKNQMSAVFDRFSSITENTRREYGGSGLGLSITQNIIQLMGGEIGAKSLIHVGSTFWFKVPLQPVTPPEVNAAAPTDSPQPRLESGRILIVDDSSVNRLVARQMLKSSLPDVAVVEADGGVNAIEFQQQESFDVILMDVIMPDIDGIEATQQILALHGKRPIVIGLTADVTKSVHQRCLDVGMDSVILKPYEKLTLINAVSRAIRTQRESS